MRMKLPLLLLVFSLFVVYPFGAQTQDRGIQSAIDDKAAGPPSPGRYHALVIGNNAYTSLPRLKTAEADAREVAALLKDFYGFETKLLLNAT